MLCHHLPNYLRTYRKRSGLSQKEVAFLLGFHSDSNVSRYEAPNHRPNLEALFAFEIIYDTPARELFAGVYDETKKKIQQRLRLLSEQWHAAGSGQSADHIENHDSKQ